MPPHHFPPLKPGPHAMRWFHNSEGPLNLSEATSLLVALAEQLPTGAVRLGNHTVKLPARVHSIIRHELAPRGETVLKIEFQWFDGLSDVAAAPIADLLPTGSGESAEPTAP